MRAGIMTAVLAAVLAVPAFAFAPDTSPRPAPRPEAERVERVSANLGFDRWIKGFRSRALAQGIRAEVFDRAFRGIAYNADVIARDRSQAEFTKTLWDYLDSAVSETRIANGRKALAEHRRLLERIEAAYGVEKEVVVAVWGLESA